MFSISGPAPGSRPPSLTQAVLLPRLMLGAFALGIFIFAGATALMNSQSSETPAAVDPPPSGLIETQDYLAYIAAALTVSTLFALPFIRPKPVSEPTREQLNPFLMRFVSSKIIAGALIEGPGLFWVVTSFLTGNLLYLFGAAFAIILLLREIPSRIQLENASGVEYREMEAILSDSE